MRLDADAVAIAIHLDAVTLDELAGTDGAPECDENVRAIDMVVAAHDLANSLRGLLGMIERDAARVVVRDVGLNDFVKEMAAYGAKEATIDGRSGTARKIPLLGVVMGKVGVSVLEIGDADKPVINKKVRDEVVKNEICEAELFDGKVGYGGGNGDADIGDDNVPVISGVKHRSAGPIVVNFPLGNTGVLLASDIGEKVGRPTEELLDDEPVE